MAADMGRGLPISQHNARTLPQGEDSWLRVFSDLWQGSAAAFLLERAARGHLHVQNAASLPFRLVPTAAMVRRFGSSAPIAMLTVRSGARRPAAGKPATPGCAGSYPTKARSITK